MNHPIIYHSWDADMLFLLFALAATAVYFVYRICAARRKPNRRVPTLPVNRKNLRGIAYLRELFIWFAFAALVILLAIACWISGRLGIWSALGMIVLLLFIPALYIYQILRLQYLPLRRALADKDFNREMADKTFLFLHDAWQYVDENWFVRVGSGYSAALCARWIDFEKPARLSSRMIFFIGGAGRTGPGERHLVSPLLRFTGCDGSEIVARLDASPDIVKWVKKHGGRIEKQL